MNKCDMVDDEELLDLVEMEIRELLKMCIRDRSRGFSASSPMIE